MVPGKKRFAALQGKRHVVGCVSGRENRFKGKTVACDFVAVAQEMVRHEIPVTGGIQGIDFAQMQVSRRPVRSFPIDRRPGFLAQPA